MDGLVSSPCNLYYYEIAIAGHNSITRETGSFLEFLNIIPILTASTSPAFHIIVPSAPGYAFSSPPPADLDFTVTDVARLMDKLMVGLGFGGGYVAQGGDIGAIIARVMAVASPSVKGTHHESFYP